MSMTKGTPASSQIIWLTTRVEQLERENSILRHELTERLVSEWIVNYEMDEKRAEEAARQYIIHMVAHEEGAE